MKKDVKRATKRAGAYLLIWICSAVCLVSYRDGNIALGIGSALFSGLSFLLMD